MVIKEWLFIENVKRYKDFVQEHFKWYIIFNKNENIFFQTKNFLSISLIWTLEKGKDGEVVYCKETKFISKKKREKVREKKGKKPR